MNEPILTSNVIDIQPRIVRRELNLDFGQFFYPSYKRIFRVRVYQSELRDEQGNKRVTKAVVRFDSILGTLNTFDERVFYILVELWQEQGKLETVYFSEREIARQLNIKWAGGDTAKTIQESLTRLRIVGIVWDGSFFHKETNRFISICNPFTILSHLKTFTTKDEGIGSQIAEFRFDERVIHNLNLNYSRPILLNTVLSFHSPLAQAIYTYLEPRLYGTNHYNRTSAGLLIEDLGLIGNTYKQRKVRVQAIKRAKAELLGKRFYYDEAITNIEIVNGKQDAIFHAYRSGAPKVKGRVIEIPHEPTPRKEPKHQESHQHRATKEATKKQKPQNRHQDPSNTKVGDSDNPTTTAKTPPQTSEEAYELIQYFLDTFNNQESSKFSPKDVLKAQEVITKHGREGAKFFVRFAKAEATKTNYKPKHIQGIIKYLDAAIAEYERLQRTAKKGEENAAKRRLENARIDHERNYQSEYFDYLDEVVVVLMDKYIKRFNEFRTWQTQERTKVVESTMSERIKEIQLRTFDSEGATLLRLQRFFQDDPEIHVPDFWEWDEQYNPNKFGYSRKKKSRE